MRTPILFPIGAVFARICSDAYSTKNGGNLPFFGRSRTSSEEQMVPEEDSIFNHIYLI